MMTFSWPWIHPDDSTTDDGRAFHGSLSNVMRLCHDRRLFQTTLLNLVTAAIEIRIRPWRPYWRAYRAGATIVNGGLDADRPQ